MLQCDKKLANLIDMYFYRHIFSILGNKLLVNFYLQFTAKVDKNNILQLTLNNTPNNVVSNAT